MLNKPKQGDYFDPAHPLTKKIYEDNRMQYPKSSDEKALELKMDKIRTFDGQYNFNNSVVRICRYLAEDGNEYCDTEEVITGVSPIGNPQEYWQRNNNYSHGEPDVQKIATIQNGEQILVAGDFVKHVKRVFELPWEAFKANNGGIREKILNNAKDGNKNMLGLRVEGAGMSRSYAKTYKEWWDIWFNYEWDDLILYCERGIKKDDTDSIAKMIEKLPADKKAQLKAKLGTK